MLLSNKYLKISMSVMNATLFSLNFIKTPTNLFAKSGPGRSSLLTDLQTPLTVCWAYVGDVVNTMFFIRGIGLSFSCISLTYYFFHEFVLVFIEFEIFLELSFQVHQPLLYHIPIVRKAHVIAS